MKCKICNSESGFIFDAIVLQKFNVKYFQCTNCDFIQTETTYYWLNEAYNSPIALLDVGILQRNYWLSNIVPSILNALPLQNGKYFDYGGGYGIFVRLMRDKGYDFYLSDKYANNLFAQFFELKDAGMSTGFDCLTAFEVFEHLTSPIEEITEMFSISDTLLFSTELQPDTKIQSVNDWWYFVPEGGQHVSLYSLKSLEQLKKHFNCNLYTNKRNLHILSKKPLPVDPFKVMDRKIFSLLGRIVNKYFKQNKTVHSLKSKSLLPKDFEYYKTILPNDKS